MSADPGYEFVDWGGMTHCPGGSHGALHVGDSLGPLLLCGFEPGVADAREQWAIRDVAELVLGHFGVGSEDSLAVGAARRRGGELGDGYRRAHRACATPRVGPCSAASTSACASRATGCSCSSSALVGGSGYVVNLARVRRAHRRPRGPPHPRRDRRLLRRGRQQLRLEPRLDLRRERRPRRLPGGAVSRVSLVGLGLNLALLELFVTALGVPGARRAGARRGADDAGELRRQQAVDVRRLGRRPSIRPDRVAARRRGHPARLARRRRAPRAATRPRAPRSPRPRARRPPETPEGFEISAARAIEIANADPHVAEQSRGHGRLTTAIQTDGGLWQVGYSGRRHRGRAGEGRRGHRRDPRGVDRLPGRVADGPRVRGPVRPHPQRALRLDPDGARVLPVPFRLPPPAADRAPRPPGAALVRDLAAVLQPGRDRALGPARLSAARLPALARMLWLGFRGGDGLAPDPRCPVAGARRGAPDRLPGDDQHRRLGGDRRRLRGHDRRRPDRPRRADLRRGRVSRRQPLWRHVRAGQLLRLRAVRARDAVERELGRAPRLARGGDRLRPRGRGGLAVCGMRLWPGPARARARGGARLRLARLSVHGLRSAVELQRLADRRAADLVARVLRPARWPAGRCSRSR